MIRWLIAPTTAIVLFLSGAAAAGAAETSFLPPEDLIRQALDQHPDVLRAAAILQSANATSTARYVGPHEITLSGEYVSRDTQTEGQFNEWYAGVSRAFRLPGKANADRHIGDLGVDVAENGYEDARHQAALSLKDLWLAWLAAEADYAIVHTVAETHEAQLSATERLLEMGEAAMLEIDLVRAALAQLRAQEANADLARQVARASLQHNFPDLVVPAVAPDLPLPSQTPLAGEWDEWRDTILQNSHEIRMAQSEAERRQWLAQRARMDRFADPTVGLRAFQERGGQENGIGVFFSIPVGGRLRNAESDALAADATAAALEARIVVRDVELIAEHDIIEVQMGMQAWQQSFAALESSAEAVARMQRSVEVGESDLTELLIAQRQDLEIRRTEASARVAAHNAILKLQIDSHSIWGLGDEA